MTDLLNPATSDALFDIVALAASAVIALLMDWRDFDTGAKRKRH